MLHLPLPVACTKGLICSSADKANMFTSRDYNVGYFMGAFLKVLGAQTSKKQIVCIVLDRLYCARESPRESPENRKKTQKILHKS